ncbi:MAG: glycosyltransferase [Myxococcota bacterium]
MDADVQEGPLRRLAFVVTRSDAPGGAQFQVLRLAAALRDAGHIARVFVGGEGPFVDLLREANVDCTPLQHMVRPIAPVSDVRGLLELRQAMVDFRPDLITAHSAKAGWLGRGVGRLLGVPSVFTVHGQPLSPGRLAPSRRILRRVDQVASTLCHSMIFVSHYDRSVAVEHGIGHPHQHAVVHNAVPDVPPSLRADVTRTPPRLIMVARLDRPKLPVLAVRALAELRDVPWTFEIVGDGPLRSEVERAVAATGLDDRITLLGARDDVPQRLAAAQAFVLASNREGLPVSVLEAMRAGLPVVVSDAGGTSETVIEGETGFVVPRKDQGAMRDALRRVLGNASVRAAMGAAGRAHYEAEFSFGVHLRRVWSVYARAIRESR